jgi:hypothetical protein
MYMNGSEQPGDELLALMQLLLVVEPRKHDNDHRSVTCIFEGMAFALHGPSYIYIAEVSQLTPS